MRWVRVKTVLYFLKRSFYEEYFSTKMCEWKKKTENLLKQKTLKETNVGTKSMGKNLKIQYIQDFTTKDVYKSKRVRKWSHTNLFRDNGDKDIVKDVLLFSGKHILVALKIDSKNSSSCQIFCNLWSLMSEKNFCVFSIFFLKKYGLQ